MMLDCPILQPRMHETLFSSSQEMQYIYVVKNYINAHDYSFINGFNTFYFFNLSRVLYML